MIHIIRTAVGCLLLSVVFGACTMHESASQDPQAAQERAEASRYPNPYGPVDPSRLNGLDPIEQLSMRDRGRIADLELHLGNAYRIINIQQRQIAQLQRVVFGIGTRNGSGIAPIGQEPIGMPPEIDASIGAPGFGSAGPIGQAPIQPEPLNAD